MGSDEQFIHSESAADAWRNAVDKALKT